MSATAYALRPWTDVVRPHPDVASGDLALGTYAANLAAVALGGAGEPVYRDAEAFFAATYFTATMVELLSDVFRALSHEGGDRVVQLKTPFGGGKTHSLLALYHLANSRQAAACVPELDQVPDPGQVRVCVLSGEYLDPARGRTVDGRTIRTLWGELAYQLGGWEGYESLLVDGEEGPPPGGERLGVLLSAAAPALVLIDEVLVYAAKAKAVRVGDTTLDRQVLLFLMNMTEAVNQARSAALVYSSSWKRSPGGSTSAASQSLATRCCGSCSAGCSPMPAMRMCAARWAGSMARCSQSNLQRRRRPTPSAARRPSQARRWSGESSTPIRSTRSCST
jgi:hypothetical protein